MKLQHIGLSILGIVVLQGAAFAEMISGTISGIDPQTKKLTLVRQDTQNPVTMSVEDQAQLLGLQPGNKVIVDANKKLFGGWKVESVTMSSEAAAGSTGSTEPTGSTSTSEGASTGSSTTGTRSDADLGQNNPSDLNSATNDKVAQDANRNLNPNPTSDSSY
jgi:hypothetical protein